MAKNKNNINRNPSKGDLLREYKSSLPRRRVSGTVHEDYGDTFSGTADFRPTERAYATAGRVVPGPSFFSKYMKEILAGIGIIITLGLALTGAVYKFGLLEGRVESIKNDIQGLKDRIGRVEDRFNGAVPARKR